MSEKRSHDAQQDHSVGVAVIGVGRMGRHHARVYHELPGANLLAVVDADAERAATLAEQYGAEALSSVEDLLGRFGDQLAAASVAVPTAYHETVAERLIDAGVACLVEKPLAPTSEIGRRLVDRARAADVLVQVGHTERFNPAVRAIAHWQINPRFIECDRVSPMTFRSVDVGVVLDMMIHDLDIILSLARSPVREVRACGVALLSEHEDVADARIEFENGCVAKITASRLAMKTERKLRVFSEAGYISLDYASKSGVAIHRTGNIEQLRACRDRLAEGADLSDLDYSDLVDIQPLEIDDEEPLRAELSNFLDAVRGQTAPAVDAAAGLAAVELAEKVVERIRAHEWSDLDMSKLV